MQIILLKPVRKLGKIGDLVKVKDGFGRNFLLPNNLAIRATKENLEFFNSKKQEFENKNKELHEEASTIAQLFDGKDFTFIRQSSSDDRLFGSVTSKEIATELAKIHSSIKYSNVHLDHPIKTIGVFEVTLVLHHDVSAKVIINVAKTQTEANEALKLFKAPVEVTEENIAS